MMPSALLVGCEMAALKLSVHAECLPVESPTGAREVGKAKGYGVCLLFSYL